MKIKIQTISTCNIIITIVVTVLFALIFKQGELEFRNYQTATEQYIVCADAAGELQKGSDYLTEQARLYVTTGMEKYLETYFEEATVTQRREHALEELGHLYSDTTAYSDLQEAFAYSQELMQTEYYAMRLTADAFLTSEQQILAWPQEIQETVLIKKDARLDSEEKVTKARAMLSDSYYIEMKTKISSDITSGTDALQHLTKTQQTKAVQIFSKLYQLLEFAMIPLVLLLVFSCVMVRWWIIRPLCTYNECIQRGEPFPNAFARELQNLAETYNQVCSENNEIQDQLQYEADHDALTGLFNRGSFEKYQTGLLLRREVFALILVDVDIFKTINDSYGHAVGDAVLKKVAELLRSGFRNIDYTCRIGGDEFAILMVNVTQRQRETISERLDAIRERLAKKDEELPRVTLSIGIAFSDDAQTDDSIFTCADRALYYTKENGKDSYTFFDASMSDVSRCNESKK